MLGGAGGGITAGWGLGWLNVAIVRDHYWPAQSATRLYWQQEGPMFSYSLLFVVCMYIISYHIISYHIILGAGPQSRPLPLVFPSFCFLLGMPIGSEMFEYLLSVNLESNLDLGAGPQSRPLPLVSLLSDRVGYSMKLKLFINKWQGPALGACSKYVFFKALWYIRRCIDVRL